MAESIGFEPMDLLSQISPLAGECLKPLDQLSIYIPFLNTNFTKHLPTNYPNIIEVSY